MCLSISVPPVLLEDSCHILKAVEKLWQYKCLLVLDPSEWEWYDTNHCLSELYFRFYSKLCQSDTQVIQKHTLVT